MLWQEHLARNLFFPAEFGWGTSRTLKTPAPGPTPERRAPGRAFARQREGTVHAQRIRTSDGHPPAAHRPELDPRKGNLWNGIGSMVPAGLAASVTAWQ